MILKKLFIIIFSSIILFGCNSAYANKKNTHLENSELTNIPTLLEIPSIILEIKPVSNKKKTYTVRGHKYTLLNKIESGKLIQTGAASYYGSFLHGTKTVSGELLDENLLTAAHPTLAINSYALVTNLKNNKKVIVRINDRGPYRKPRVIDLSKEAAAAIGMLSSGIQDVKVEGIIVEDDGYLSGKGAETLYHLAKQKGISIKTRKQGHSLAIK